MQFFILLVYCVTIFTGSFLLFQVQPIFAKIILPWFGGTPNVWTVCLVFYQVLLFLGYLYSFIAQSFLSLKKQALCHISLLIISLFILNIYPERNSQDITIETWYIIQLLVTHIAFPYFLIATCSPLVQSWLSLTFQNKKVYRLYALSNFASFLALFTYPFLVEPSLSVTEQTAFWESGYIVFISFYLLLTIHVFFHGKDLKRTTRFFVPTEIRSQILQVVVMAALGVVLLLAVTNFICYDIAVIPFLWILPLAIYLFTFILSFSSKGLYWPKIYIPGSIFFILLFATGLLDSPITPILLTIFFAMLMLFVLCMLLHGEIAQRQPEPRYLTLYYLAISFGGALGGLFVGLVAPVIFNNYLELDLAFAVILLMLWWLYKDKFNFGSKLQFSGRLKIYTLIFCCGFFIAIISQYHLSNRQVIEKVRNFYGVLTVRESYKNIPKLIQEHGRITHGSELLSARDKGIFVPTTYYAPRGGGGMAILAAQQLQSSVKIGVVGMGVATMAGYGREADSFLFYEINDDVIRQAKKYFSYLKNSAADIKIFSGDARIVLEKQVVNKFDVLILDAFSSDAIPIHLLTKEAFELYLKHLKQNGLMAVHITNQHLDILPVMKQLSNYFSLNLIHVEDDGDANLDISPSSWVLLTRNSNMFKQEQFKVYQKLNENKQIKNVRLWTDDYSNLFEILR